MDKNSKKIVSHKIKNISEMSVLIEKRPRNKKVIMCHGTFDVVHPGHIRHLLFAKSKADILVVSLTADKHITKANFRPFVPEDLRAINLAALGFVDFVIIDKNVTPIENIKIIQPDYFAKGYEYSNKILGKKTNEEVETINNYGGEMIFTPGDIVYSSSEIIEEEAPNIRNEKLLILMEAEGISFENLLDSLDGLSKLKVHVVGDTIIDRLTFTSMLGGMTKTPTMSVLYEKKEDYVGGAGIVSKHIRAAGVKTVFTTLLGDDESSEFLSKDIKNNGIKLNAIIDKTRPTTVKNAIISGSYRLLKIDVLDNRSITLNILEDFKKHISQENCDVLIFSDFRHGIFNKETIDDLIKSIPNDTFKVADSQVASRWGNIAEFKNFNLITPNEREARFALGDQDSVIRPLATNLYKITACETMILKLGARGILTHRSRNKDDPRTHYSIDSFAEKIVDAVGAGDALLAYASLVLVSTKNDVIASIIGNIAAGLECEKNGNVPIKVDVIKERILKIKRSSEFTTVK
jgi:rfaE bifunctional protein kinase chain/domain